MGYFTCSFSSSAGILTTVERTGHLHLCIWILGLKSHIRAKKKILCVKNTRSVCSSVSNGERFGAWPDPSCQGELTLETSALGWQKAASPELSGSLIQGCPASWYSWSCGRVEKNCWWLSVKFCLSWTSFSCHCLSFSLKKFCWVAGQQALALPSS